LTRVDVMLRPRVLADERFIRATWLRAYRHVVRAPSDWYYAAQGALVSRLLAESETTVAHFPGDSDQILGYVVASGDVLHWVYTKGAFRRLGIASALLDSALAERPRRATHWTDDAHEVGEKLGLVRDVAALLPQRAHA